VTKAALFDVDKTLVTANTARLYVQWRMGRREAGLSEYWLMTRTLLRYAIGTLDAEEAARAGFRTIIGYSESRMREECLGWYKSVVRPLISAHGRREVERLLAAGSHCALLTSATPYVAEPLAEELGIAHVICTRPVVEGGVFTGTWEPPLCYGAGKVTRAKAWAAELGLDLREASFYTDSITDLPMLEAVGQPRIINPDFRLRRLARQRGYPIEAWT
jgi:HAD superfamily hydrolase (TIGR01490 family)